MCLACCATMPKPLNTIPVAGKEDIDKIFGKYFQLEKSSLTLANNKTIYLTQEMVDEIKEHALALVVTGVDLSTDIWAIQWPRDYVVKSIKIT